MLASVQMILPLDDFPEGEQEREMKLDDLTWQHARLGVVSFSLYLSIVLSIAPLN